MDALRAREQLRRRYLFPSDTDAHSEASRDREGYAIRGASAAVEKKQKPLPRLNIHSGFWILASIVVTYYVNFFKTIKENFHTSSWFPFGSALLLLSVCTALYCILYLEWYRGIADYDVRYPALVPLTTAAFIVAGICFNVALWPVWSFFTPLLLFTQFMGVVMLISLLG